MAGILAHHVVSLSSTAWRNATTLSVALMPAVVGVSGGRSATPLPVSFVIILSGLVRVKE
jgi:hypothetical protein